MPDAPDFEAIARAALASALVVIEAHSEEYPTARPLITQLPRDVAEQLRLVWNARGAADVAKLVEVMDGLDHPEILGRSLLSLDR